MPPTHRHSRPPSSWQNRTGWRGVTSPTGGGCFSNPVSDGQQCGGKRSTHKRAPDPCVADSLESQIQILNSLTVQFHFLHTPGKLRDFVAASTRVTHTDPKAFFGAMAVTISAQLSSIGEPLHSEFLSLFSAAVPEPDASELKDLLERAVKSATANESAIDFAQSIGAKHGVSGYVYQTVPVEIHI